ncbi:MAG: diguanylate cyclase [Comamonas sp.]
MRSIPPSAPPSGGATELLPALLLQSIHQAFNAVMITDGAQNDYRIVYVNPALCKMTGYAAHELIGRNARLLQGPQTSREVIAELRRCLDEGSFFEGSTFNYRKDGTPYLLEWNISPVCDAGGRITHFVSVQHDMSALAAARASSEVFARTLDTTEDGVLICNHLGVIEFSNHGYEKITGLRTRDLTGRLLSDLHSGGIDPVRLKDGNPVRGIFTILRTDGTQVHCEESSTPLRNLQGQVTHHVSLVRDVTARVLAERAFREQLQHDGLTGTLTRAAGSLLLEEAMAQARAQGTPLALALVDVDRFKQVNDGFGHPAGDRALVAVARALASCLRSSDKIIRWGGDEFLLVMAGCDQAGAVATLERCRQAVRQVGTQVVPMPITISAGVGVLRDGEELAPTIERIDQLLYRAKQDGRDQIRVVETGSS